MFGVLIAVGGSLSIGHGTQAAVLKSQSIATTAGSSTYAELVDLSTTLAAFKT
jgi:hypothetical protein